MYARHARVFGYRISFIFPLAARLTPIGPLITPMESARKQALAAAVNMSCQQARLAAAKARVPARGDGSV